MENLYQKITEATEFIRTRYSQNIELGLILGSGLGDLADVVENPTLIPYQDIPHFATSSVQGHHGILVLGELEGKKVGILKGRTHYYEGYTAHQITFPVRIFKALGAQILIATNASGGLNPEFMPGDMMVIRDHINMIPDNPLRGPNDSRLGVRFPDVTDAYNPQLGDLAIQAGKDLGISLKQGVYVSVSGPNYETYAELDYLRSAGADAVGMSTVPEILVARHGEMRCLGISCITDVIKRGHGVSHDEVLAVAQATKPKFMGLLKEVIKRI